MLGTRGERVRVLTLVDRGGPSSGATGDVSERRRRATSTRSAKLGATLMVKDGDSLWSIARGLVGPRASNAAVERKLVAIWDANERVIGSGNPHLIFPGPGFTSDLSVGPACTSDARRADDPLGSLR